MANVAKSVVVKGLKAHHGDAVGVERCLVQRLGQHVRRVFSGGDVVSLDDLILVR